MNFSRRTFVNASLMFMLVVGFLVGCSDDTSGSSSNSDGKVELRVGHLWGAGEGKGEVMHARINKFMEENPDIKIIEETAPGEEFKTKIKVDLASNNFQDVVIYWAGESLLRPLVESDVLLDMEKYLEVSESVTKDQWTEQTFKYGGILDDTLYALPIEGFSGFTLYNKEIFDKFNLQPPTTYQEWKEVAKVLRENDIIPLAMGSQGSNPGHFMFNAIAAQLPGGVEASEGLTTSYNFETEPFMKTAEIIDEMRQLEFFPDDTISNGGWDNSIITYNQGKAAMIYTYPFVLNDINPENSVLMNFPKMDGAVQDPKDFTIGGLTSSLVINRESFEDEKLRDAIVKFSDFILEDEFIGELVETGMPPAKKIDYTNIEVEPFHAEVFGFTEKQGIVNFLKAEFPTNGSTEAFNSAMDELFAGAITPEEFIEKIQKQLDEDKE